MRELIGDAWTVAPGSVLCITTNGVVKRNGSAVMGAGIAKQATRRLKGIDEKLGAQLKLRGNHTQLIGYYFPAGKRTAVVAFPVKHHWRDSADINLIQRSAKELVKLSDKLGWSEIYLPRPGCGNGNLEWSEVKPILSVILDNRFIIIDLI
ncbi:Macro domain-like protein [Listeria phage LIS04]|nr:Macro domain-like protein [Listeria phage LIS04]